MTIHYEGNENIKEDLKKIKSLGMKPALVINPDTEVDVIKDYLEDNLINIMSPRHKICLTSISQAPV